MIGTALNQYRITASIGAGGMGEVFRARDTRLNRDVAIKVLPKDFVADADRLRRFEQEAKTLAALNHPNVLTVHDAGVHEGAPYLVSELLEGKTLREEMKGGALAVRKATEYAQQMANGLAAAHSKGVIHRDLKPENIFVTKDGRVKILDFGLAKLRSVKTRSTASQTKKIGDGAESVPTIRIDADAIINTTEPGMVLGTPAYMSPEQVRGEPADHRADIFAFGCVLYEMLSGTRAFRRDTPVESMNAVLSEEPPDLSATNAEIPLALERIARRCLEKLPERRFQSASDLAFAVESAGTISTSAQLSRVAGRVHSTWKQRLPWAFAALCLAVAVPVALRRPSSLDSSKTSAKPILRRFELNLPTPNRPMISGQEMHPVISPDGRKIAFANAEGLWLRRLDSVGPPVQLVAGGNISSPFWSPRSTEVGFFDSTKLLRVSVEGGRPESIAEVEGFNAQGGGGAAWLEDDRIFLTTGMSGLSVVPAPGGPLKPVWEIHPEDGISDLHQPSPLPGAIGGLVVVHRRETNGSALFGIDTLAVWKPTGEHQVIWQDPTFVVGRPVYCPSGHVLFQRGVETTEIWAVPFSLEKLARTGEAFRVADLGGDPSASADGTLLFPTLSAGAVLGPRQLVWVDHTGKLLDTLGQVFPALSSPALSPDQHRILAVAGKGPRDFNLWLIETAGGGALPLTRNGFNFAPFWSADGHTVFFWRVFGPQLTQTLILPVNGISEEKLVFPFPAYPSPGGKYFLTEGDETNRVSAAGWRYAEADKRNLAPIPLARVFGSVNEPRFSPDERWLALSSSVSGRREVWVADFPAVTNRIQVSRSGGRGPVWHPGGSELFFLTLDGKSMMSARQKPDGAGFEEPRKLFSVPETVWTGTIQSIRAYDVAADGERFLMLRRADEIVSTNGPARPNAILVENWFEEFREKK